MSRQMVGVIYFTSLGVSPVGRRLATAAPPGWWSSPEPLSKNPSWVASQAAAGLNVSGYSYSLNSPISLVDPDGKHPLIIVAVAIGAGLFWLKFSSGNADARLARNKTTGRDMPGDRNGMGDAMRHCIWSCEMSRDIGPRWSEVFGTAHELGGQLRDFPEAEREMDLHNNQCGRDVARNDKKTCFWACQDAYYSGELETLPNQGVRFVR